MPGLLGRADASIKALMYRYRTTVKSKHVDAFLRYNSPTKLRNLVRVEWGKRLGRTERFGYPYMLTVEPTNRCNLQCTLCPTGRGLVGRKKQRMDLARFRDLIDEVGPYVYAINFQAWGEPLIAPDTPEMVRYSHDRGIYTAISTNGNYPSRMNRELVDAGLDHISVAIDGSTQEIYETYRVKGNLERVEHNVRELIREREAQGRHWPFVEIQFLVFPHNEHELPDIRRLAGRLGVDGTLIRAAVAPGNESNRRRFYTWNNQQGFCSRFWYTAIINADGGVTPCCNFFYKEDDLGTLSQEGFEATWNGQAYRDARRAVAQGDRAALPENCRQCKVFGASLGKTDYGVRIEGEGADSPVAAASRERR